MDVNAREGLVLEKLLVLCTAWSGLSILGYLTDYDGPEFLWWIFGGFLFPLRVLFIPIPESINSLLWSDFLGLFPRAALLTVAFGAFSMLVIKTGNRRWIPLVIGLAAVHVVGRILTFIDWMSEGPLFDAFKWSIIGLIPPLMLGLTLSALLYHEKAGYLRGLRSRLVATANGSGESAPGHKAPGHKAPPPPPQ